MAAAARESSSMWETWVQPLVQMEGRDGGMEGGGKEGKPELFRFKDVIQNSEIFKSPKNQN